MYRNWVFLGLIVFASVLPPGQATDKEEPECYWLKTRENQCIYFLENYEDAECEDDYGGMCYVPLNEDDLKVIRVIMFWKDLDYEKVATGLTFSEDRKWFVPRRITNYWESKESNVKVDPKDVNYDGKNGTYILISWNKQATKAFTTAVDHIDPSIPMLCQRTARISKDTKLPGPYGYILE